MARERWQVLLDYAMKLLQGLPRNFALGGGTVLRFLYNHRDSNDIDIFIFDRQLLAYVSPRTNDALEDIMTHYVETEYFTKLSFSEGEIDFIPAIMITDVPPTIQRVAGHDIPVESPVEIVAKKIRYRLEQFKSRDFFDLLTVYKYDGAALARARRFFEPSLPRLQARCEALIDSGAFAREMSQFAILAGGTAIMNEYKALARGFFADFGQSCVTRASRGKEEQ